MSDYATHIGVGFIFALVVMMFMRHMLVWYPLTLPLGILYLLVIVIYSILPDVDHPISKITWIFIGASILGFALGYFWAALALLIGVFIATQFTHHRGIIHSILFGVIFSVPLYLNFGLPIAILGFACYYSHLVADGEWAKLT